MAKKRVEEELPQMEMQQEEIPVMQQTEQPITGPVNPLRNERVIVRFVASPNALVQTKGHVLSGGMSENATRSFVVPLLRTGQYMNVLTKNEKDFLERAMGLEPNALNVYRKTDNFWDDTNAQGIGRVTLHKQDNYLDLSNPVDYIKYKILLANKDQIASSLQELEERPKATYQFVIISENAEAKSNLSKMDATMQCYTEYGAIREDKDTLRVVLETFDKRPQSQNVKLDWLQGKVNEYIQKDPRRFLQIITDELLPAKVLIKKCIEAGLISWRNNLYYLKADGSPLCELGEDSTLNNAARYISSVKHTELKYQLEAQLKEE